MDTPEGTFISFRVRTASTIEELPAAEWVAVARTPPDLAPVSVAGAFAEASLTRLRYLEVEATLVADRSSLTEVITPRLRSMAVTHTCPPVIE